jgi:hypothetical protein
LPKPGDCEKQETETVLWQDHSGGPAVKSPKMRIVLVDQSASTAWISARLVHGL